MRRTLLLAASALILTVSPATSAAEPPKVEKYLHSGELTRGEQELAAALEADRKNDEIRFGLGLLQFVRAVERLGQSLHEYGVRSENTHLPFLRLPVPNNPDPAAISHQALRRLLDDFRRSLIETDTTLAGIVDADVKLRVRLEPIRLDLDGDGKPTDRFMDMMKKLLRQNLDLPEGNKDFLVCFDRGDVAWLRGYCNLLAAMLDFALAFDTEPIFDVFCEQQFARPKKSRADRTTTVGSTFKIVEPARLARARRHLLRVAHLNRETWKYVRAEKDDDHEWLPNPKQKGVLGLPVRDGMIDAWLDAVAELEAALEGKKLVPVFWRGAGGKGLNLKKALDDPPAEIDLNRLFNEGPIAKYLEDGKELDVNVLSRLVTVFDNPAMYGLWFN